MLTSSKASQSRRRISRIDAHGLQEEAWVAEQFGAPMQAIGEKQATPTGSPLPSWEGQVEITPEDVADALRDWDAKAPKRFRGLLLTERPEGD